MCTTIHQTCTLCSALELAVPQSLSQLERQMLSAKQKPFFVYVATLRDTEGGGMENEVIAWVSV